jgi:5-methylcytosine-specific restriction endonuclease McrA
MLATPPSALDSAALARRLAELAGDERAVQVEFLLHLDEFDRRRAYLDAAYGSLWDYCLRALHLREGAAGRRIGAMRVLRRFPALEPALRDGRLCLSTASLLGQVLTDENLADLVGRAAYRTKAEVEQLVVSIKPRPTPVEGVRRLPMPQAGQAAPALEVVAPSGDGCGPVLAPAPTTPSPATEARATAEAPQATRSPSTSEVRPVAEERWSVRVTLDAEAKADLDALRALLSHKIPDGELGAVVREAIRCARETYAKRKGAIIAPRDSTQGLKVPTSSSNAIPAAVRRAVWQRDGGRCTFEGPDGHRCESRWQLELDHIISVALGGASTVENLRLRCRAHNLLEAERVFGREHMDQFRREACGGR